MMFKTLIIITALAVSSCKTNRNQDKRQKTDSITKTECEKIIKSVRQVGGDTLGMIASIPENFEGCLLQLDTLLGNPMKEWIKCLPDGEFSTNVHMGLGRHLRNEWGLWGSKNLTKNLYAMGMLHPDDMTGVILTSYQRRIKGEDIRLEEQLKYYQDFWRVAGVNVDSFLQEISSKKR